jgi:plasmid stabilization system protein ParE
MSAAALPVVFTRQAERHLEEAVSCWRANRPAAPNLLPEELSRALDIIAVHPAAGSIARVGGCPV